MKLFNVQGTTKVYLWILSCLCALPMLFLWSINTLCELGGSTLYIDHSIWSYIVSLVLLGVVKV